MSLLSFVSLYYSWLSMYKVYFKCKWCHSDWYNLCAANSNLFQGKIFPYYSHNLLLQFSEVCPYWCPWTPKMKSEINSVWLHSHNIMCCKISFEGKFVSFQPAPFQQWFEICSVKKEVFCVVHFCSNRHKNRWHNFERYLSLFNQQQILCHLLIPFQETIVQYRMCLY